MNYFLHTSDLRMDIAHRAEQFAETNGGVYPRLLEPTTGILGIAGINKASIMALIEAMALDVLLANAIWMRKPGTDPATAGHEQANMEAQLAKMIPNWDNPTNQIEARQQFDFYTEVVDSAWEALLARVSVLIGEKSPWVVWYLRRVGSDLLLEQGDDYRITDWTRRTQSGEWASDDATEALRQSMIAMVATPPEDPNVAVRRLDRARRRAARLEESTGAL